MTLALAAAGKSLKNVAEKLDTFALLILIKGMKTTASKSPFYAALVEASAARKESKLWKWKKEAARRRMKEKMEKERKTLDMI